MRKFGSSFGILSYLGYSVSVTSFVNINSEMTSLIKIEQSMYDKARLYNEEKTVSSINGAGKSEQPHVKR